MASVRALLPYQWRAYWRSLRARSVWAGANLTVVLVVAALMLPAHIGACVVATVRMRSDALGQGALVAELVLTGVLVAWLTLPRGVPPAALVDPLEYDPEDDGEPEGLMRHPDLRWGMATTCVPTGPSVVDRVLCVVAVSEVRAVEGRLARRGD